jgi:hypothetical protein
LIAAWPARARGLLGRAFVASSGPRPPLTTQAGVCVEPRGRGAAP